MAFRVSSLHENRFEVIAPDNFVVELIHVSLLFFDWISLDVSFAFRISVGTMGPKDFLSFYKKKYIYSFPITGAKVVAC